jgi:hypothetical protein
MRLLLLEHIEADLESSPFHGEGYRKVWARLRVLENVWKRASHHAQRARVFAVVVGAGAPPGVAP